MLAVARPPLAVAQSSAALAEALFEEGRRDVENGDLDSACRKFRDSDNLDPGAGTKLNWADCEEKRGKLATAWELFKRVEDELDPTDDRWPLAKQRRETIEPRVPKLILVLAQDAPSGTVVDLDGMELSAASYGVSLPVDPGAHRLVVSAPQHSNQTLEISLRVGQQTEVSVSPGAPVVQSSETAAPALPPPQTAAPVDDASPRHRHRQLGYAVVGGGAVALLVGAATGLVVLDKKRTAEKYCDSETRTCEQPGIDANRVGPKWGLASGIAFAVGAGGLGVGSYLVLRGDRNPERSTTLRVRVGPGGGYLALGRHF